MGIVLNSPIVRVDGVQVTLFGLEQNFFKRMKKSLKDENIYDVSISNVPFTSRMVTFTGIADSVAQSLVAYNETKDGKKPIKSFVAGANREFEVSVRLRNGKNKISIETVVGSAVAMASNSVQLNAYKLSTWLFTYSEELDRTRDFLAKTRQNRKLRDSTDFDGNAIDNTGEGLTNAFGQFITPLVRLEGSTVTQWRSAIRDILEAYGVAASVKAMNLVSQFFTGENAEYKFFKSENRLRRPLYSENFFQASAANPGVDTTFVWKDRQVYLYNRWWIAEGTTATLTTGTTSYIYYDGTQTTGAVGINRLDSIVTTIVPVVNGSRTITETVLSGEIFTDTYGRVTGLSGELYVRASFPISGLNGVSGTALFTTGITGASVVENSSTFIDLGHAQLGQNKPQYFGSLSLSYETPLEIFEVATVKTDSTTVTDMITGLRYDEVSGVIRETQVAQNAGEMLLYNSQTLASGVRNILTGVLVDVKPPRTFWHVFMEDITTGDMKFYAKV